MLSFSAFIKNLHELEQSNVDELEGVDELPFDNIFGDAYRIVIPFVSDNSKEIKQKIEAIPGKKLHVNLSNSTVDEEGITLQGKPFKRTQRLGAFIQKNHPELMGLFNKSAGNYVIVLSRHPIDVARMSDFHHLQSCHSQGGDYFHCAMAEAKGQGLVAYLVKKNYIDVVADDLPTKEEIFLDPERNVHGIVPNARVRVRKFHNEDNDYDLAIPEIRIYGNDADGFLDSVKDWLYNKQKSKWGKDAPDMADFVRHGGYYTDNVSSKLFNYFFDTNHFSGDVEHKGDGGQSRADQFEEEIDLIRGRYNFNNPVWGDASVSDDMQDPSVYLQGLIEFTYHLDKKFNIKNYDYGKIRKLEGLISDAVKSFGTDNISIETDNDDIVIRCDLAVTDYGYHPDDFKFLMDDLQRYDRDHYAKEWNDVRAILMDWGILKSSELPIDNLEKQGFIHFKVEPTGGATKITSWQKLGTLKADMPMGSLKYDATVRRTPLNTAQVEKLADGVAGFDEFKKLLNSKIINLLKSYRNQQTIPGIKHELIKTKNIIPPQIDFYFVNNHDHSYNVFMEVHWDMSAKYDVAVINNTIKLLHSLDRDFDHLISGIMRQFWVVVQSKYKYSSLRQTP